MSSLSMKSIDLTLACLLCTGVILSLACIDSERLALLRIKQSLEDPLMKLSSWNGTMCCSWNGVYCRNGIGPVTELHLAYMSLGGELSSSLLELSHLRSLNLSWNDFNGSLIPEFMGAFPRLEYLDLSYSNFSGLVPHQLGNLTTLRFLDMGSSNSKYDSFPAIIVDDLSWVSRLTSLLYLGLDGVELSRCSGWLLDINKLKRLSELRLSATKPPNIPLSLAHLNLTSLIVLDLSKNDFKSPLPQWLSNLSKLRVLDLSENNFMGTIHDAFSGMKSLAFIRLSNNLLQGALPNSICQMENLRAVILSDNLLSGELPDCWQSSQPLEGMYLGNNFFSGNIPPSLGSIKDLRLLHLTNNSLSGELPSSLMNCRQLQVLALGNNNISGRIPASVGSLKELMSLQLNNNHISGELPASLMNCTQLQVLDLGENNLWGNIPSWIGKGLSSLVILRLHSNSFSGRIPDDLSLLSNLRVLDLGNNSLSGVIPASFGGFAGMIYRQYMGKIERYNNTESVLIFIKGIQLEYSTTLNMMTSIDLSSNKLEGSIPDELTSLMCLHALNLSQNMLWGAMPMSIGKLHTLESLDLSRNQLSGLIPPSISALRTLSKMNLSYNNLQGMIPTGSQLQTFDELSYIGNPKLCGYPLKTPCRGDVSQTNNRTEITKDEEADSEMKWFYSGLAPGFVVGVCIIWGAFLIRSSWKWRPLKVRIHSSIRDII